MKTMFTKSCLGLLLTLLALPVWAQLQLRINSLPANTPEMPSIHAAGSFNNWNAAGNILVRQPDGTYLVTLAVQPGTYEYKFTRGSWATVEGNASGNFRPNRVVNYTGGELTVDHQVLSWEDLGGGTGTASTNVVLLSNNFQMPQLGTSRRIWIYLPPDYATSNRQYPVLYMHDGQNLFDESLSFSGEWEVDESLNALFNAGDDGIIVVGIDNGGASRIDEYTPWPNPSYGGGNGEAYVDFIVQTLKPYIDANYRTRSDQPNTGIMGSSLGGLISLYAILAHQDVFGRAGVFSPSLWFTEDIYTFAQQTPKQRDVRIYFLAGEQESSSIDVVADVQRMYQTLRARGFGADELFAVSHPDGQHSEWYWAREFADAYEWLFATVTVLEGSPALRQVSFSPNPATTSIRFVNLPQTNSSWKAVVYSPSGTEVLRTTLASGELNVAPLAAGFYFLVVYNEDREWAVCKLQKF